MEVRAQKSLAGHMGAVWLGSWRVSLRRNYQSMSYLNMIVLFGWR